MAGTLIRFSPSRLVSKAQMGFYTSCGTYAYIHVLLCIHIDAQKYICGNALLAYKHTYIRKHP
jgi:hypothetical protein